jgi:hypothetical protein
VLFERHRLFLVLERLEGAGDAAAATARQQAMADAEAVRRTGRAG